MWESGLGEGDGLWRGCCGWLPGTQGLGIEIRSTSSCLLSSLWVGETVAFYLSEFEYWLPQLLAQPLVGLGLQPSHVEGQCPRGADLQSSRASSST